MTVAEAGDRIVRKKGNKVAPYGVSITLAKYRSIYIPGGADVGDRVQGPSVVK